MSGQDTEPGATFFQVFATTFETFHEPVFAPIDFEITSKGAPRASTFRDGWRLAASPSSIR